MIVSTFPNALKYLRRDSNRSDPGEFRVDLPSSSSTDSPPTNRLSKELGPGVGDVLNLLKWVSVHILIDGPARFILKIFTLGQGGV